MGRLSAYLLALLLGATAMVTLSSCGGSDTSGLLPGATASEINSNLDKVQELVASGDCAGAQGASEEVNAQIETLEGVDSRLKEALSEGASRLAEVVSTCEEVPNEEDEEAAAQEAEEDLRAEEEAEEKKEKKEKPVKPKPEKEQKEPKGPSSEPPGQEKKEEVIPPEEESGGTGSGGVGPASPAEGE